MKKGSVIKFDGVKNFSFVRKLGFGGTGETHLFKEILTDTDFAIKKFSPSPNNDSVDTFRYFIEEIKILFNITHPHIVRIYNYYLYEGQKAGYIQMEYINGNTIDTYEVSDNQTRPGSKSWEELFIQTIDAFCYLEEKSILHRDIRAGNIMVDSDDNIKIIDFGFGKILNPDVLNNSIILNWPATTHAEEVQNRSGYTHATEIYYLGALFTNILTSKNINFKYQSIIDKMIQVRLDERYQSFDEVDQAIKELESSNYNFSKAHKTIYQEFIDELKSSINNFHVDCEFERDYSVVTSKLNTFRDANTLANTIPNNSTLISCFVDGSYKYSPWVSVYSQTVENFIDMLNELNIKQRDIVYNNLFNTLKSMPITIDEDDVLPF